MCSHRHTHAPRGVFPSRGAESHLGSDGLGTFRGLEQLWGGHAQRRHLREVGSQDGDEGRVGLASGPGNDLRLSGSYPLHLSGGVDLRDLRPGGGPLDRAGTSAAPGQLDLGGKNRPLPDLDIGSGGIDPNGDDGFIRYDYGDLSSDPGGGEEETGGPRTHAENR